MIKLFFVVICSACFVYGSFCRVDYNAPTTCSSVANALSNSTQNLIKQFKQTRNSLILEPTNELNNQIIKNNLLNSEVYKEQQSIMSIDNAIATEMQKQIFLLEKLTQLKEISIKEQELILKSGLNQDE